MLTMSTSLAFMCLRPRPTCTEAGFWALRSRFWWVFFVLGSFERLQLSAYALPLAFLDLSGCVSDHVADWKVKSCAQARFAGCCR